MTDAALDSAAPLTLFEKIWRQHRIGEERNGTAVLAVDRIFLHERTGAVALKTLRSRGYPVCDPARVFCTMDHMTFPGTTAAEAPVLSRRAVKLV